MIKFSNNLPKNKPLKDTKVIVGMSGGVDSSVSALLLKKQGYHVEGLFMKNWEEDDGTEYCTAMNDLADAQSVCDTINIKLHKANFVAEYWNNVFEPFLCAYKKGYTPNPDILCNKEIKFKAFLDYAQILQADCIAMGHYARCKLIDGHACLQKGLDNNKDQSYFLHQVSSDQFAKTLFPIGEIKKQKVRKIAEAHNLITHNKKDSTGICFIGKRIFSDFLKQYLPEQPGLIISVSGKIIGKHAGLMFHTIGQRHGLGIGGLKNTSESPWYVVDKDLNNNILIVAQGSNHPLLFFQAITASSLFWISGSAPTLPANLTAKIRYRQKDQLCHLEQTEDGRYLIIFNEPQWAVTPGQCIVFYQGDICLGGGVIETRHRSIDKLWSDISRSS